MRFFIGWLVVITGFYLGTATVHAAPTTQTTVIATRGGLNAVKWPAKGQSRAFLLAPSSKPYDLDAHMIPAGAKLELASADPSKPATIRFADVWPTKKQAGPDCGSPWTEGTIQVSGEIYAHDFHTIGGERIILFGSKPGSRLRGAHIVLDDGGGAWRGSGCDLAEFDDVVSKGKPWAYLFANFTNTAKRVCIRYSKPTVIQQGGRFLNAQPNGEAACRIMDEDFLLVENVVTAPWFHKPGHIWKQDWQFRPDSKVAMANHCTFWMPDIGDMTWRDPPHRIESVTFSNCTLHTWPHLTPGAGKVSYVNCIVGGKVVNK